jgi:glyoxylate reductase/D-3-phosphoglycerate dehydrogenase
MAEPTIFLAPELDADVLALARDLLPPGFRLDVAGREDLPAAAPDADYLLLFQGAGWLSDDTLRRARRLKLIQLLSVGYDDVNVAGARRAHVPVALNGGANALAVAEHTIMLMLAALKHLPALDQQVRAGRWRGGAVGALRPRELRGATVGIVGLGRIGQQVAQRLRGWDVRLLYAQPRRLPAVQEQALGVAYRPLDELLRASDVVSLHAPLNGLTHHLIDARALRQLRPTAVLVNTARGGLVDEAALAEALRRGRLGAAALDVLCAEPPPPDHPLLRLPNVVLTPHLAGPTWESWPRRFQNCYANIDRVERGERPWWVVPELSELAA